MNWVDIVIIIFVVGLGLFGWRSGVIKIAFTLLGAVIGLILAGRLWDDVAGQLPIDNESFAKIAAFVLILVLVTTFAWIAGRLLKVFLKLLLLGWVDGFAGAAMGLLLGGLAATAVVSAAGIVPSSSVQGAVHNSTLAEPLIKNMGIVFALLPSEFDSVKDLVNQGKDLIDSGDSFLEQSGQLQSLIAEGTNLLEHAGNLRELIERSQRLTNGETDLIVGFNGMENFPGAPINAVIKSSGAVTLGPLTTSVLPSGVAVLAVQGTDSSENYTLFYYVDVNYNGECDGADQTGSAPVDAGVGELGISLIPAASTKVCARF
jgi:membrane protein required for colicin V production